MTSKFILNSKEIEINKFFLKIGEIKNKDIPNQLMEKPYEIKSKVSYEVFKSFIDYLDKGTIPEIYMDNFYEYSLINQEFQLDYIKDLLNEKRKEFRRIEEIIKSHSNSNNQIDVEQSIAQLYNIVALQKEQIEKLQRDLNSQKIENETNFNEMRTKIDRNEELMLQKNLFLENLINEKYEKLRDSIQEVNRNLNSNQSLSSTQERINQEYSNSIETLRNNFSSLNDLFTSHRDQVNELERDVNASLEKINQQLPQHQSLINNCITKAILFNAFNQIYVFCLFNSYFSFIEFYLLYLFIKFLI